MTISLIFETDKRSFEKEFDIFSTISKVKQEIADEIGTSISAFTIACDGDALDDDDDTTLVELDIPDFAVIQVILKEFSVQVDISDKRTKFDLKVSDLIQELNKQVAERSKFQYQIWKFFTQILCHRNNLTNVLKPFFENLKNENINDDKNIPFLKSLSLFQLYTLYESEIITKAKLSSLLSNNNPKTTFTNEIIDIIKEDKEKELDELIQKEGITKFAVIKEPFREVSIMKIPLLQYCIMKNAIKCFKFLLINGYCDPNKTMKDHETHYIYTLGSRKRIRRYKWNSLATAQYFGNKEIVRILESRVNNNEIMRNIKSLSYIEASVFSYQNSIIEQIIEDMEQNQNQEYYKKILNQGIITCSKNNNIHGAKLVIKKGCNIETLDEYDFKAPIHYAAEFNSKEVGELLIAKGVDVNIIDIIYHNIIILFLIKII